MCGICGFNWEDKYLIKKMTEVIYHRGPDKEGFFVGDGISLGNRRLSIIDLSEKGTQPIYNEDKSICITYNGEIYNFQEIKRKLKDKGHRFVSNTDTEVVVHAYEEYGPGCLEEFNGMFSFALWDSKRKRLFLARDRIGIKPLYYYHDGKKFIFASEIKAILQDKDVERKINNQALYYYLGFEFVPAPMTMFENILKLPPGHYLLYEKGKIKITRYWDLEFFPDQEKSKGFYKEGIVELLGRSVKRRLISDVPLGVFLSGGLDSSTVVAFMRRNISGPLKTFSIGYRDKTYSELDYAREVARHFDTEHEILMVDSITPDDIEKTLWHLDEPMTDLSTIPLYMICKKAREDVIVVLSGEGGDEVFVGYDRFIASKAYNLYRLLPQAFRDYVLGGLVKRLPDQSQKKGMVNVVRRFVEGASLPEEGGHMRWQYFSNPRQDERLYLEPFKKQVFFDAFSPIRESISHCNSADRLDREIYIDMRFTMPESILMKVDKMSMANSLEIRVPFLDHELIEFSARIPSSLKLKGFTTKAIFRKAVRDFLPSHIVRRGKQGYSFPSKNWLREQLKGYMIELLNSSPLIKENLNLGYVRTLIKQHLAKTHNHNHILWALINAAVWHNKFFT